MADVQPENGYTRIANELFDAMLVHPLSLRHQTAFLSVVRLTYGYNKKSAIISGSRVAEISGLARNHASTALRDLFEMGIIWRKDKGHNRFEIGIVKDYEKWQTLTDVSPKLGTQSQNRTSPKSGTSESQIGDKNAPKLGQHIKDNRQLLKTIDQSLLGIDPRIKGREHFLEGLIVRYGLETVEQGWAKVPAHATSPLPYLKTILERNAQGAPTHGHANRKPERESLNARARREANEKLARLFDSPVASDDGALRAQVDERVRH